MGVPPEHPGSVCSFSAHSLAVLFDFLSLSFLLCKMERRLVLCKEAVKAKQDYSCKLLGR